MSELHLDDEFIDLYKKFQLASVEHSLHSSDKELDQTSIDILRQSLFDWLDYTLKHSAGNNDYAKWLRLNYDFYTVILDRLNAAQVSINNQHPTVTQKRYEHYKEKITLLFSNLNLAYGSLQRQIEFLKENETLKTKNIATRVKTAGNHVLSILDSISSNGYFLWFKLNNEQLRKHYNYITEKTDSLKASHPTLLLSISQKLDTAYETFTKAYKKTGAEEVAIVATVKTALEKSIKIDKLSLLEKLKHKLETAVCKSSNFLQGIWNFFRHPIDTLKATFILLKRTPGKIAAALLLAGGLSLAACALVILGVGALGAVGAALSAIPTTSSITTTIILPTVGIVGTGALVPLNITLAGVASTMLAMIPGSLIISGSFVAASAVSLLGAAGGEYSALAKAEEEFANQLKQFNLSLKKTGLTKAEFEQLRKALICSINKQQAILRDQTLQFSTALSNYTTNPNGNNAFLSVSHHIQNTQLTVPIPSTELLVQHSIYSHETPSAQPVTTESEDLTPSPHTP